MIFVDRQFAAGGLQAGDNPVHVFNGIRAAAVRRADFSGGQQMDPVGNRVLTAGRRDRHTG